MSDFLLPGHPGEKREQPPIPPTTPTSTTGLPPEVEAELRARMAQGPLAVSPPLVTRPSAPSFADRLKAWGPIGTFLIFLATKLKFLTILIPVIKTGGSMLAFAWLEA